MVSLKSLNNHADILKASVKDLLRIADLTMPYLSKRIGKPDDISMVPLEHII